MQDEDGSTAPLKSTGWIVTKATSSWQPNKRLGEAPYIETSSKSHAPQPKPKTGDALLNSYKPTSEYQVLLVWKALIWHAGDTWKINQALAFLSSAQYSPCFKYAEVLLLTLAWFEAQHVPDLCIPTHPW
eukprot:1140464-Pelagomonas_calceolata.AAC.1